MRVVLYRVGRNLNRANRTCEAFGIGVMDLVRCDARLSGRLYGADGGVVVRTSLTFPEGSEVLALDTWAESPLSEVAWGGVGVLLLGGETSGLPRRLRKVVGQVARIPTVGRCSGLTVILSLVGFSTCAGEEHLDVFREAVAHRIGEIAGDDVAVTVGDRRVLRVRGVPVAGRTVEVRGLSPEASVAVQATGIGGRRRFGAGSFTAS